MEHTNGTYKREIWDRWAVLEEGETSIMVAPSSKRQGNEMFAQALEACRVSMTHLLYRVLRVLEILYIWLNDGKMQSFPGIQKSPKTTKELTDNSGSVSRKECYRCTFHESNKR